MLSRIVLPIALVTLGSAQAAVASTLPPLDFHANQVMVGVGVLDANLDYALGERLSVGLTASPLASGGRLTCRLGESDVLSYGLTLGGGLTPNVWGNRGDAPLTYSPWLQPAIVVGYRFGGPEGPLSLRGSVGPLFSVSESGMLFSNRDAWFWPNAELAYRLNPSQELTLGGNGVVGWRGTF